MDIMAGLITVLVVESRKQNVMAEMGSLPAYDYLALYASTVVDRDDHGMV
jgi:hypothetical protein